MNREQLEKLEIWSKIAGQIGIPVAIALVGYFIQARITDVSVRKDYVQIAISILRDDDKKIDPKLHAWAARVFQENSPVPVPDDIIPALRPDLLKYCPRIPPPPADVMKPAAKFIMIDAKSLEEKLKDPRQIPNVLTYLLDNHSANAARCMATENTLTFFQRYVDIITNEQGTGLQPTPNP